MSRERSLRALGALFALAAAAIHFALASANLIPGETTATPAFVLMGLGFVGCAAALLLTRERELLVIVAVYAVSLIVAYGATRSTFPVEGLGLGAQAAEVALAAVAVGLLRRRG